MNNVTQVQEICVACEGRSLREQYESEKNSVRFQAIWCAKCRKDFEERYYIAQAEPEKHFFLAVNDSTKKEG